MVITVNGKSETLEPAMTIHDLLMRRSLKPETVVVEVNLEIIDRERFLKTQLRERDVVEILRFVGGG